MTQTVYRHCDEMPASHRAADVIVPLILQLTGDVRSVVDVGGGDGGWLRAFQAHGCDEVLLCDHPDVRPHLLVAPESFHPVDMLHDQLPQRRFELALCLECAEHLPASRAHWLVRSLVSLADIIVFSAAIPGQGGKGHVNEQPHYYWTDLFHQHGFRCHDILRGQIIRNPTIPWWYRQNMFVYASERTTALSSSQNFLPEDMCVVHRSVLTRLLFCGIRERTRLLIADVRRRLFRQHD